MGRQRAETLGNSEIADGTPEHALSVEGLSKSFGEVCAVRDLTFGVSKGELVSLLGPSGCGKTTVLNAIAGFIEPDGGKITLSGEDVTRVPPYRRDTAMVFQNYALFPHMTVEQNVAFGLKTSRQRGSRIASEGADRDKVGSRVSEALEMLGLEALGDRYPARLSGGQQQRVALARALVVRPKVLLMDEPLSNLDAKLRQEIRQELRNLQQRLGQTVVFVTHDQQEAFAISDRVVLMREGEIVQQGAPAELFRGPRTVFAADFVGVSNVFAGRLERNRFVTEGGLALPVSTGNNAVSVDGSHAGVRPSAVNIAHAQAPPGSDGSASIEGRVRSSTYLGESVRYSVEVPGSKRPFVVDKPDNGCGRGYEKGDRVVLTIAADDVLLLSD